MRCQDAYNRLDHAIKCDGSGLALANYKKYRIYISTYVIIYPLPFDYRQKEITATSEFYMQNVLKLI